MKRVITGMVIVWAAAMAVLLFAHPLRARYYAWRLARADEPLDRDYYTARLANHPDAAVSAVGGLLDHPDADIRLRVLRLLALTEQNEAIASLLRALSDSSRRVRDDAAIVLGRRGEADFLPALERIALGEDPNAAAAAVYALQLTGHVRAPEVMLRVLRKQESPKPIVQAMESLTLLGETQAIPLLRDRTEDTRCVSYVPSNERSLRRGLRSQPSPALMAAATSSRPCTHASKTVADYARESLRRLSPEQVSKPSTTTTQSAPSRG